MRSIFRTAFLAAVPVEALNFWVVGYPAGGHSLSSASQNAAVALQWYVLHLPGIVIVDRSQYLRLHSWAHSVVLFMVGYINTALLIALVLWIVRLAKSLARRLSSPRRSDARSAEPRSSRLSA